MQNKPEAKPGMVSEVPEMVSQSRSTGETRQVALSHSFA